MRVLRPAVAVALIFQVGLYPGVNTRGMIDRCIPGPTPKFVTKDGNEFDCDAACGQDSYVSGCEQCCPASQGTKNEDEEFEEKREDVDTNPGSPGGGNVPKKGVFIALGVILPIVLLSLVIAGFTIYRRGRQGRLGPGPERGQEEEPDQQAQSEADYEAVPLKTFANDLAKPETGTPGELYSASQEHLASATWSR